MCETRDVGHNTTLQQQAALIRSNHGQCTPFHLSSSAYPAVLRSSLSFFQFFFFSAGRSLATNPTSFFSEIFVRRNDVAESREKSCNVPGHHEQAGDSHLPAVSREETPRRTKEVLNSVEVPTHAKGYLRLCAPEQDRNNAEREYRSKQPPR